MNRRRTLTQQPRTTALRPGAQRKTSPAFAAGLHSAAGLRGLRTLLMVVGMVAFAGTASAQNEFEGFDDTELQDLGRSSDFQRPRTQDRDAGFGFDDGPLNPAATAAGIDDRIEPPAGTFRGRIQLIDRAELAAAQNGIIAFDVPEVGRRVRKGEVIARLDDSVPQASLRVAEAEAANDVDARVARAISRVAAKELASAEAANQLFARTVSPVELERLKLTRVRSDLDIEKAETTYAVAKAREDEAEAVLTTYEIDAPFAGVIRTRFKQRGEAVRQGDPIVELVSADRVSVVASVPIAMLPSLQEGNTVQVLPYYLPGAQPLPGTIRLIDRYGDGNPSDSTIKVTVEAENTTGTLLPGLQAAVRF